MSIEQVKATVYVSWILQDKNGIIKNYHVVYTAKDDSADMMNVTTKEMKQNFEDLNKGRTYEFQVRVSQYFFVDSVEVYSFICLFIIYLFCLFYGIDLI